MGYEFHIRRQDPIPLEAWLDYVERDPELRRIDKVTMTNPVSGALIEIPGEGMAVWTVLGDRGPVFDFREGRISVRGRRAVIPKMKAVAAVFGAIVVGDEGEEY